ncbi:MAG: DUF1818 family protein [Cyanobacteria bacterium J06623_5]
MPRKLLSGQGWRLGWDPEAEQFCGLLGGECWAVELTAVELRDFCNAAQSLGRTMAAMSEQLMAEERLTCEQETETVWLEAEGLPSQYSLRFILLTGRRGEGEWPATALPGLLEAAEKTINQLSL